MVQLYGTFTWNTKGKEEALHWRNKHTHIQSGADISFPSELLLKGFTTSVAIKVLQQSAVFQRKESRSSRTSLLLSNTPFHPQWNSARAWQDLSGCLPLPCRCYKLEHSRSAKWGDWSQLDLWLLNPPPTPPPPHRLLLPLCHRRHLFLLRFPFSLLSLCHYPLLPRLLNF